MNISFSSLPQYLISNPILSQRITFNDDRTITIYPGKVEIGQGIVSAIAQIAAEELDIDYTSIRICPVTTPISPNEASTSGSRSIQEGGESMRFACAEIRHLFIQAFEKKFGIPFHQIQIQDGVFSGNAKDGPKSSYWDLLNAVNLNVAANGRAHPKSFKDYQVIGLPLQRKDLWKKFTGAAFLQDLEFPEMLHARIVRPPSFHARLKTIDETQIANIPGLKKIVRHESFIGVLAVKEEDAIFAMNAVQKLTTWDEFPSLPDMHQLEQFLFSQPTEDEILKDSNQISQPDGKHIRATYTRPYLAHASIGPSCAVAKWQDQKLHIWSHSQSIYALRDEIAKLLQLQSEQVLVTHSEGAGCYGHNGADDAAFDAALLSIECEGTPIRVQWMREDEFAWEPFGPAMAVKLQGAVDAKGKIVHWHEEVWGNRHIGRAGRQPKPGLLAAWHMGEGMPAPLPTDMPLAMGGGSQRNAVPYYDLPNCKVINHALQTMPIRTSALRALGAYLNVFSIESFMDELAEIANIDPISFRIQHLSDERAIAVLEALREHYYSAQTEKGNGEFGIGVAFARYKNVGNYAAVLARVQVEQEIRVQKIVAIIDCGLIINPDGVLNQIEGGIVQSISWTLKEQLKFDNMRITSRNWADYPILKFSEVPKVEVQLINRPDQPSLGVGEGVMGPVAAAIANAVTNALGVRVRNLPLNKENVIAAMS